MYARTLINLSAPLFLLGACDTPGSTPLPPGSVAKPAALLVGSDNTNSGDLHAVDLNTRMVQKIDTTVDKQPVVRVYGDRVYVLDQSKGRVRVYAPAQGFAQVQDFVTGPDATFAVKSNPHDIYVDTAQQRAYITLYGALGATTIDGAHALGIVDLQKPEAGISRFLPLNVAVGDPDKNPEAAGLVACGGKLYVALQDLDATKFLAPIAPSRLAAVSLSDPNQISYIQLAGQNPVAMSLIGGECKTLLLGHADNQYSGLLTDKGGLEIVDLAAARSLGLAVTAKMLGGNVSAMDAVDLGRVYVDVVVTPDSMNFDHSVVTVNTSAKKVNAAVLGPLAFVPAVRIWQDQVLVLSGGVPDAKRNHLAAGLFIGKADGSAIATTAINTGLPPQSIDLYQ